MIRNLRNALDNKGITIKSFADFLEISEKTAQNKIRSVTAFTYPEVYKTKTQMFPEYDIEYLFKDFPNQTAS